MYISNTLQVHVFDRDNEDMLENYNAVELENYNAVEIFYQIF